jgi:hypothetical protein
VAATDLSSASPGTLGLHTKRVTLEATGTNARELIVPDWARYLLITVTDSSGTAGAGSVASSGTDGSAIGNDVMPIAAGATLTLPVAAGGKIYLSGPNSGYAHVTLCARG